MTNKQLDTTIKKLEHKIRMEIKKCEQLLTKSEQLLTKSDILVSKAVLLEDDFLDLKDFFSSHKKVFAKLGTKSDNMKSPKNNKKANFKEKILLKEINPLHEAIRLAKLDLPILLRNSKTTPKKRSKK